MLYISFSTFPAFSSFFCTQSAALTAFSTSDLKGEPRTMGRASENPFALGTGSLMTSYVPTHLPQC